MSRCRSCRAEILWAIWEETGKRAPFDPEPVYGGNVILYPGDPPRAVYAREPNGVPLYVSHFATCPDSDSWRKE